jgi:type II secretory pathway predicted ATPase ExeA
MSHLAAATEETDCLVVIRGADGSGKTTLLNRYLANLDEEIFFATIDENCKTATEFYGTFLTQLGFKDITGSLQELRRITEQFLMHQASGDNTVLVVIDNAHLVKPTVLEQLRRIAEVSYEDRRVLSIVIAGNSTLSRIIDSPAMRGLKFRSHVDFHIRMFGEDETAEYINYRLTQAGNAAAVSFEGNSMSLIHRFTGGSPGPLNKLCSAILAEACAEETHIVSEQMVRAIASNEELLPHVLPLYNKGRRKGDRTEVERIQERQANPDANKKKKEKKKKGEAGNSEEIAQLKESLAETRQALRESEKARKEAIADLKKEQLALTSARDSAEKAKEKSHELESLRNGLLSSVQELKADLKTADKLGSELDGVEEKLRQAEEECNTLRKQVADIPELEQKIADKDARIAILTADMARLTESVTATQTILTDEVDIPKPGKEAKSGNSSGPIGLLEISRENEVMRTLKLDDAPSRIMIGRDGDCDLCLEGKFVSRHHALLYCSDTFMRIEDLNSYNGTLVNLKKVNRAEIHADDLIIIGDYHIRARRSED